MNLVIVFENEQVLVVDKPSGLIVNKSQTANKQTLQDQLSEYFKLGKGDLGVGDRAGIVHRLDRETSGLLLVAKTQLAFANLQAQFKERKVIKQYLALVHGLVGDKHGTIKSSLGRIGRFGKFGVVDFQAGGGREARTDFKVIKHYRFKPNYFNVLIHQYKYSKNRTGYLGQHASYYTLLSCHPKTGRTHQIRVHLKSIGNPCVSDLIYTPAKLLKFDLAWCPRFFLHASYLEFVDPQTKKKVDFRLDLPNELKNVMLDLKEV